MASIKDVWVWLWSLSDRERKAKDSLEKLQMSMRVTAKSRYNAAARLQSQNQFAFFTTTVLSLGLVFIPLMQNAAIPLAFQSNVLNMMQIFLGVSVMVYSIIIGTARFDIRAEKLTDCGDRLKELIRTIDMERLLNKDFSIEQLTECHRRYSDVVTDSENHARSDYDLATLEMRNDYYITGLPRLLIYLKAYFSNGLAYIMPLLMLSFEVIFITDMVGATKVLTPYLNGSSVS